MKFAVSDHAARRYRDRVRPNLTLRAARSDLERIARSQGRLVVEAPTWVIDDHPDSTDGRRYLLIGDDIALVLEPDGKMLVGITVLLRGGLSPQARARRNRKAANKRARRRTLRRKNR